MSSKSQDEGMGSDGVRDGMREVCSPMCLRILSGASILLGQILVYFLKVGVAFTNDERQLNKH